MHSLMTSQGKSFVPSMAANRIWFPFIPSRGWSIIILFFLLRSKDYVSYSVSLIRVCLVVVLLSLLRTSKLTKITKQQMLTRPLMGRRISRMTFLQGDRSSLKMKTRTGERLCSSLLSFDPRNRIICPRILPDPLNRGTLVLPFLPKAQFPQTQ